MGVAYKGRALEFPVELGWVKTGMTEAVASRELISEGHLCVSYLQ